MTYQIEFSRPAQKQFNALSMEIQERLQHRIDALAENPRPSGVKKLQGQENQYRIRVGDYRVIYEIRDLELLVILIRIGSRQDVYCNL